MKQFKQHWYAPAACANYNLTTREPIAGGAQCHRVDNLGATGGFAAVKPFPLDQRGCLVRREGNGDITITLGSRLVDYWRGTPAEIAALLRARAAALTAVDCTPTRYPSVGESREEWERSGEGPMANLRALYLERAALIAEANLVPA